MTTGDPERPRSPGLPILPVLEEHDDEDDADNDRPTVLITGASGNIGRKLRDAWADRYSLVLLDLESDDASEVHEADLSRWDESWPALFEGVDVVVHLAANPNDSATWDAVVGPNIDGTANVFHAAGLSGVSRVVFASSNHAMGGYRPLEGPITEDLPPLPDGPYGATKLMGERLGLALSRAFEMEFVALRIGWVQVDDNRPETMPDDWSRGIWLSNEDLVRLATCAVEAPLPAVDFIVVNGTSANSGSRWPLDRARALLGYEPQDDGLA